MGEAFPSERPTGEAHGVICSVCGRVSLQGRRGSRYREMGIFGPHCQGTEEPGACLGRGWAAGRSAGRVEHCPWAPQGRFLSGHALETCSADAPACRSHASPPLPAASSVATPPPWPVTLLRVFKLPL